MPEFHEKELIVNFSDLQETQVPEAETTRSQRIGQEAKQRATIGCPYCYYFEQLTYRYAIGVLTLQGKLPTFHLKQVLQTRLKGLDGVKRIDNQVEVVNATGLS